MTLQPRAMGILSMCQVLLSFFHGYPEILLAFACFFFIRIINRKNMLILNWPVLGMLPSLLLNVHRLRDWGTDILRRSGCTFVFKGPWFTDMEVLFTCDPANVNHILNTNFSNYPKGSNFLAIFDILGDGIFNSDSELWQSQRKMAHAVMGDQNFRRYVERTSLDKVENCLVPFLEHVARHDMVVDLQDVMQRFTFDMTSILVFGVDPECLSIGFPTVPFAKAIDDAMEALVFRYIVPESWWKVLRWMRLGEERRLAKAWGTIDHFIAQQISVRREKVLQREAEDSKISLSKDLLSSYMDDKVVHGSIGSKSDKFLRDTALNLMLAGRDTTGAALTWFFWLISKNPLAETKILDELRANFPRIDVNSPQKIRVFNPEELKGLVYLHAALCETLRLFPPVPTEQKGALKQDVLPCGEKVRPGMKIMFSMYAMGRMEGVWGKDCLEFKPERWISEKGRLKFEPSYKFLAFNAGPRSCLGKVVAFTQMKAAAAAFIYNFRVETLKGHPVKPKIAVILHMKHGLKVRVRERYQH